MPTQLKLTQEVADAIKARVKSLDAGEIEKLRKDQKTSGTFDVIISTEAIDRAGEIVRQDGWDLGNYKNNPIVLWGHDYYSLPVGVCLETYNTTYRGTPALGARGVFLSADINPYAQQVRKLYDFGNKQGHGVGCTTSVGFIPKEFDPNNASIITRAELLEFSFVPIPAQAGVGPAAGRALTFEEATEIGLDIFAMRAKGVSFAEIIQKESEAGDSCQMDDGTLGILASDPKDPDGALVCVPAANDKAKEDEDNGDTMQKELMKSLDDEHGRHTKAVAAHLDAFKKAAAAVQKPNSEDDGDDANKAFEKAQSEIKKCLKAMRDAVGDEHDMHKSVNVECFRSFAPPKEKKEEVDKAPHIKALKAEHKAYEQKCNNSLDEFETKALAGDEHDNDEDEGNSHTDWITKTLAAHADGHKGEVTKCAKAMCEAFGTNDETEEKIVIAVAYLDEMLGDAQLGEAHKYLKAAKAVLEAMGLGDGSGEVQPADVAAPALERSRPAGNASAEDGLDAHLFARDILREVTTLVGTHLEDLNKKVRDYHRQGKK